MSKDCLSVLLVEKNNYVTIRTVRVSAYVQLVAGRLTHDGGLTCCTESIVISFIF